MKLKQKILLLMFLVLIFLIFLEYYFVSYNKHIENLTNFNDLKLEEKKLEEKIVELNKQKSQLQNNINYLKESITNLNKSMNFRNISKYSEQIKSINQTILEKQNEIKDIDNNINKISKEIDIIKKIVIQPFDIIVNDITNYPEGFVKLQKENFIINSIMTGMPEISSEPTKLMINKKETIILPNDSKTNTILAISPVENNSFPVLFTLELIYKGDTNAWELSTADKNRDFMPNYIYNNEILEIENFSSKFLHDNKTYKRDNKNIKIANVNLGNKIMCITTTGEVLDKNNNTYAKVEMSYKGMKIEFLNDKDSISGIIIILSPKIVNIQIPE